MQAVVSTEQCLKIVCRCDEYHKIVDNCALYTIGTQNPVIPKFDIEPVASAKVSWVPARSEINRDVSYPVLQCYIPAETEIDTKSVDKKWIPVIEDLVSLKNLRPNLCYLHETRWNTQSAVISTLTDMLPHRGQVVKRKDIDWGMDYCMPPLHTTDKPETHFGHVQSCFSKWAKAYTRSTGLLPY